MASTNCQAVGGLEWLDGENSEFPGSNSSGEWGDDICSYDRPSFRANTSEFCSSESKVDGDIYYTGKLIF